MPRVIESEPPIEKQARCSQGCGKLIAYVPNDIKEISGRDISGGPDGCRYIDCPGCGKRIVLESW